MKSVLFYSFKGGVGRTQTMLNMAKYLSKEQNKKILLVDFDIYAPGLSYLAKFNSSTEEIKPSYMLDFLLKSFEGEKVKLYTEKIADNLYLAPAYNINIMKNNHNSLSEFSQYLYSLKMGAQNRNENAITIADNVFKYIMETIEKDNDFDYVFFDARTGVTEVSDILFSNFLDLKVIVSSFNKQNIKGTNSILELLSEQIGKKHKILRILSPEPQDYKREVFKTIEQEADLKANKKDEDLRKQFDWMGVHKISYEKEIVANDFDAWNNVSENYKKEIISISSLVQDKLSTDERLKDILS